MMNNDCKCKKQGITTQYIGDMPVDNLDSLPDAILAERDIVNPATGENRTVLVRVPAQKLFGSGTMDNVTTIEPNNEIEVPDGQVRCGKIVNNGSYNTVELTDTPDFLIVGKLADLLLIQSTGFVYFPNGHEFIVGADYYAGADGLPTTNDELGNKIFKPISATKLVITLGQ